MKCWACQGKMICKDSRPLFGGKQRGRRYHCQACGEDVYTVETIVRPEELWQLTRRSRYERK